MSATNPQKIDREFENIMRLAGDLATKREAWESRPTAIEFSFNNLCNLKCQMCAKADDEPNVLMNKSAGNRALEQLLPHTLHWMPSANSEPLLNDMTALIELCRKHITWLLLFTNATLLTRERFLQIRERTHRIFISFDSHVKATFELIRTGARYDEVVRNIKDILPIAKEDGTEITFNVVLMKPNLPQLPDYVNWVADVGGEIIHVQELLPNSTHFHHLLIDAPDQEIAEILARTRANARARQVDLYLDLRPPFQSEDVHHHREWSKAPLATMRERFNYAIRALYPGFCHMAAYYFKVNPNGDVFPCCRAPDELNMGNINRNTVEEIWNGPQYREFRRNMFTGNYAKSCSNCYVLVGNPHYQQMIKASGSQPTTV
ncbi:MAG: radical SAM/SPASM domain-containing protein [Planctomycetota bacterium]